MKIYHAMILAEEANTITAEVNALRAAGGLHDNEMRFRTVETSKGILMAEDLVGLSRLRIVVSSLEGHRDAVREATGQ